MKVLICIVTIIRISHARKISQSDEGWKYEAINKNTLLFFKDDMTYLLKPYWKKGIIRIQVVEKVCCLLFLLFVFIKI